MEHLRQLLNLFFKLLGDLSEKKMMNHQKFYIPLFILGLILSFSSCNDDNSLEDVGTGNVSFSDETYRAPESIDSVIVPIGIDNPYHSGGSVEIEITNATYGVDYTTDKDTSNFVLDFLENEVSKEFEIKPIDNSVLNTDTELEIRIKKVTGGLKIGRIPFLQVIFQDDEERMTAEVAFDTLQYELTESDTLGIDLGFSSLSTDGGTITIVGGAGDAVYGEDYIIEGANEDGEITLDVDEYGNAASFNVIALDNDDFEENKTFKLQVLEVTGGLTIGENSIAEVTILEDDPSPFASVGFDQNSTASAGENSGEVSIDLALSQAISGAQTVEVSLGSASTASLGDDFTFADGNTDAPYILNLEDGATTASITLQLNDDDEEEGNETIILNIGAVSGDLQVDENSDSFTFTIEDDETENTGGGDESSYLETFESGDSNTPLEDFGYTSEVTSNTTVPTPESSSFSVNKANGKFADADDETAPSDIGIQIGYVNKAGEDENGSGSIDNLVISPEFGSATGSNYSFTYDVSNSKPNSTATIGVYYSTDSDGSSFSNGNWTLLESYGDTSLGADRNLFARRQLDIPVTGTFHIAIRLKVDIGEPDSDTEGTRYRFDNFRITSN